MDLTAVLSEALKGIRVRRRSEDPDALLDECLSLLESVASTVVAPGLATALDGTTRRHERASVLHDPFPEVDGRSPEIDALKRHMMRVAEDSHVTVLILGESGTGKERVARAIHRASSRGRAPFVVVNCAGLSPTLIEDELFGHIRGAFTGAISDQPGPFERANGGTVFLDEVGELTPDVQMKLLRALQQRTVQRLGSRHETVFDVRVIAATNADLAHASARGRFRQDLYYRLKVYELRVPPLRHRGATHLEPLVGALLKRLGECRQRPVPTLDSVVWDLFASYSWPGNVRELENTLERMMVAAGDTRLLTPEHLPEDFDRRSRRVAHAARKCSETETDLTCALPSAADVAAALARNNFRRARTAAELGVSRHQLYRLRKRYDIRSTMDARHESDCTKRPPPVSDLAADAGGV